jgi:hypothetical protein
MSKHLGLYQRIVEYPIIALIILLPFNGLISTYTRYKLGIENFWIYKDALILITLLAGIWYFWKKLLKPIPLLIGVFSLFMILSILWAPDNSLIRLVVGAKYNFIFLSAFIAGLFVSEISLPEKYTKIAIISGISAILISLFLHFIITPEGFTNFGYRNDWSTHYAGKAPAYCQRIENNDLCRLQGTFSGPNQLGAYLLILNALIFSFGKFRLRTKYILMGGLFLVCLLTFSRSAILGLLVMNGLYIAKNLSKKQLLISTGIAGALLTIIVIAKSELFLRPESTIGHFESWKMGLTHFLQSPIYGNGLATSGSASNFFANPIIPENWFLGIAGQTGIIGLALFLGIYALSAKKSNQLILGLGMLVPLMLLHSFEDSTVAYMYFLLLGIVGKE